MFRLGITSLSDVQYIILLANLNLFPQINKLAYETVIALAWGSVNETALPPSRRAIRVAP